jgi:hypothetical protein
MMIISSCSFAGVFIISFLHRELPPNLTSQPTSLRCLPTSLFALILLLISAYNGSLSSVFTSLFCPSPYGFPPTNFSEESMREWSSSLKLVYSLRLLSTSASLFDLGIFLYLELELKLNSANIFRVEFEPSLNLYKVLSSLDSIRL